MFCNFLFSQKNSGNIFNWLEGEWKLNSANELSFENWKVINDSTLSGKSIFISKNDTISEILRIDRIGKNWVYIATVNQSNPILFTLNTVSENIFEFINPEHDFPQKIVYKIVDENLLLVWIEGQDNGKFKRIDFGFSKK
ncbi:MAG: hypothetical protein A2033_13715 [Bacteroidetes bacterium GWA2_31_9]|nr:MAG: hypothetical protein A2033_13715 [Bacteroidetes bacterium GWA2_31_9]